MADAKIVAVVALLLVAATHRDAESSETTLTGADFLAACSRPDPEWIGFCHGYVQAVIDRDDGRDICPPRSLTRAQIVGAVVEQLTAKPSLQRSNAALVVQDLLRNEHPCRWKWCSDMPNIDLGEAIKLAAEDEFWAVRGKAIQGYATLEQAMASLLAALGGMHKEVGAIIYFKIASADARNKIIATLFKKKFGNRFNLFRNSLFDQLRPIDQERNEVVHWNAACQAGHDGSKTTAVVVLTPAAILSGKKPQIKTIDDVRAFDAKAQFYARLVNMFMLVTCDATDVPMSEDQKGPWLDIFSQPIVYPPPTDHPLFPKPETLENHIQAFLV